MEYHSALRDELEVNGELKEFRNGESVVFEWDLTHGMHPYFREAQALYSEPSWRHGYPKFLARANREGSSVFSEYLVALKGLVHALQIPAYIFMGKHMLQALDPPFVLPVRKDAFDALAGVWYASPLPKTIDHVDALLGYVCSQYRVILDPSCGYGNVAAAAREFVCSDINRHCVYYVAKTHMGLPVRKEQA